jgi:hypothetical protein
VLAAFFGAVVFLRKSNNYTVSSSILSGNPFSENKLVLSLGSTIKAVTKSKVGTLSA